MTTENQKLAFLIQRLMQVVPNCKFIQLLLVACDHLLVCCVYIACGHLVVYNVVK